MTLQYNLSSKCKINTFREKTITINNETIPFPVMFLMFFGPFRIFWMQLSYHPDQFGYVFPVSDYVSRFSSLPTKGFFVETYV